MSGCEAAREGAGDGREQEYERAISVVTGLLQASSMRSRDIEDLVQETMVRLVARDRRDVVDDLVAMAIVIAKHVVLEFVRDRKRSQIFHPREVVLLEVTEGAAALVAREHESGRREIGEVLARRTALKPEAIEFALLVLVDELTVKEAGRKIGCSWLRSRALREQVRREFSKDVVNLWALQSLLE